MAGVQEAVRETRHGEAQGCVRTYACVHPLFGSETIKGRNILLTYLARAGERLLGRGERDLEEEGLLARPRCSDFPAL